MQTIGPFAYVRHRPSVPALDADRDPARHRVAIVGGGPVGLLLALALARWKIPSVVLEADDTVCVGSRAICISRRSLEIIAQVGALDAFLGKGLDWAGGRSFYRTTEIFRFAMLHDDDQKLPPMINIQQYWIEQFLVDAIDRHRGLIDLRWANEVTGFVRRADGVEISVRAGGTADDAATGHPSGAAETDAAAGARIGYALDADWLVACDGGQSLVRKQLGLKLEGTAFEGKYVIVDIELPSAYPAERRAWFDPPSNPGYTVLMHKQPDDVWRIDYQIPDDADLDAALAEPAVTAFVRRHLEMIGDAGLPWRLLWISAYRAGAMTLPRYRYDRVLFVGNAAHAMPIFGVRGLNSGFDDAYNLAWKLAAVLHGRSPAALLDTYSEERLHAFHVNAASAIQSTEFMAPPSRGFALMREAALSLAERHPHIASVVNPRQTSAIDYDRSPLNTPSDDFDAGPAPGSVTSDCPLGGMVDATHLSDLLGPHWTALAFADDGRLAPRIDDALRTLEAGPIPFRTIVVAGAAADRAATEVGERRLRVLDEAARIARRYCAADGTVYLIRPDAHVAGRWRHPDPAVIQTAIARAHPTPNHARGRA
ncbi:MAG: FAD-dependent monooxygenase [Burkholderiaceae bacterium]|nr:FAD-dependent monooxygenase [Burkholderiaceae bacterium]